MATIGQYPIAGVQPEEGQNPGVRQELRDLRKNDPDQFNLYMLGLQLFQTSKKFPESHPLSYFQIAGIHGEPYKPWPQEPWNTPKIGRSDSGYCTHTSILFLTWHRPYLALFEEQLYKHVKDAAESYKDPALRQRYMKAAKTFRMPYWDWARTDLPIFPEEALAKSKFPITIKHPETGKDVQLQNNSQAQYPLRNPLISCPFRGAQVEFKDPRFQTPATFRSSNFEGKDDEENRQALNSRVDNNKGRNLTERVTYILDSYDKYKPMSSNQVPDQPSRNFENYGSLEDIHNAVHGYIGGHMGKIQYSAFDPIFWLHHTNIDRLFAIWQVLNGGDGKGETWITPTETNGNYTNPPGIKEKGSTPLTPFYHTKEKLYSSEETRNTASLGSVYPETQYWEVPYDADTVRSKLRKLYPEGNLIRMVKQLKTASPAAKALQADLNAKAGLHALVKQNRMTTQQFMGVAEGNVPPPDPVALPGRFLGELVERNTYLEWLVLIEGEKHALNGEYMVHVFLGPPDDSVPELYVASPTHVGAFVPLGQGPDTRCEKCVQEQDAHLKVVGQIPLTIALMERYMAGLIDSLEPNDVVDYLKVNLHWRVTLAHGERRDPSEVGGLQVAVGSNEVALATDENGRRTFSPDIVMYPAATSNLQNQGRGMGTGYTGSD